MIYRFDYAHKEAARVEELKNGPHTVGLRTTLRAVQSGKALRVYVAEDADVFVRRRVQEVCAAPNVVASAGLLEGRRFTIYPGCERYQPGMQTAPSAELAETDGTVITGKGPGATFHFAAAIARALGAAESEIDALWNGMFLPPR